MSFILINGRSMSDSIQQWYNVLVDFEVILYDHSLNNVFPRAIHTEHIGPDQFQVGLGVHAPTEKEAHRIAVNLIEARVATLDAGNIDWIDSDVYDE